MNANTYSVSSTKFAAQAPSSISGAIGYALSEGRKYSPHSWPVTILVNTNPVARVWTDRLVILDGAGELSDAIEDEAAQHGLTIVES